MSQSYSCSFAQLTVASSVMLSPGTLIVTSSSSESSSFVSFSVTVAVFVILPPEVASWLVTVKVYVKVALSVKPFQTLGSMLADISNPEGCSVISSMTSAISSISIRLCGPTLGVRFSLSLIPEVSAESISALTVKPEILLLLSTVKLYGNSLDSAVASDTGPSARLLPA